MATKKEDTQLGYDFEDEIKGIFKELITKYPIFWHQFTDSKSARNYVASQPADFMITSLNMPTYLLEAKASVLKPSLAQCAKTHIRPSQIGMAKKWIRAGNPALFIFYCQADNHVELWDGKYITECISENIKPIAEEGIVGQCDYFKLKEFLTEFFCRSYGDKIKV